MSNQLTSEQRYAIYLRQPKGWKKNAIAEEIGVHPSTVGRELKRNRCASGEYVWLSAQRKAESRKHGFKSNNSKPPELWWRIDQMIIEEDWSPGQIAGVLRKEGIRICKQTIYNHVHADKTGKLVSHLPHELKYNKRAKGTNRPRRPISPTGRAYTSVRRKQTESASETGRWIQSSTHTDMLYLR